MISTTSVASGTRRRPTRRGARRTAAVLGAVLAGATALGAAQTATADAQGRTDATVHARGGLISHVRPSTHAPRTYVFPDRSAVNLDCRVDATEVDGRDNWYLVSAEGDANWVSGRYLTLHHKVKKCATRRIDATSTTKTGLFEGPSRDDVRIGTLHRGDSLVVRCFTGHQDGPVRPWVLTEKSNWVRASAIRTTTTIPYCTRYL